MGWLDRLTGRKKAAEPEDEIPENYDALLESAQMYIMKAMIPVGFALLFLQSLAQAIQSALAYGVAGDKP